jgi:hypothetical protein
MAIQRTRKISDLEKRLKLLNQQLYGKKEERRSSSSKTSSTLSNAPTFSLPAVGVATISDRKFDDVTYLKKDLTRITILAGAALGVQFLLYYLIQNHLVNLSFLNLHF